MKYRGLAFAAWASARGVLAADFFGEVASQLHAAGLEAGNSIPKISVVQTKKALAEAALTESTSSETLLEIPYNVWDFDGEQGPESDSFTQWSNPLWQHVETMSNKWKNANSRTTDGTQTTPAYFYSYLYFYFYRNFYF
eukprot:g1569.t1